MLISPGSISPNTPRILQRGVEIILINATSVPPHVILGINGRVWGFGVKGAMLGEPINKYLELINKKKIRTLFFELICNKTNISQVEPEADRIFNIKEEIRATGPTCFTPIKAFAENIFSKKFDHLKYCFDLLDELEKSGYIKKISAMNFEMEFSEGFFSLPKYGIKEIESGIVQLKNNLSA